MYVIFVEIGKLSDMESPIWSMRYEFHICKYVSHVSCYIVWWLLCSKFTPIQMIFNSKHCSKTSKSDSPLFLVHCIQYSRYIHTRLFQTQPTTFSSQHNVHTMVRTPICFAMLKTSLWKILPMRCTDITAVSVFVLSIMDWTNSNCFLVI